MSIDLSKVTAISDQYGSYAKIEDAQGRVLWELPNNKPVILEVEKITSDTYAGETTYTGEQFILLGITPKSANSTVKVTYGGLTKTLTFSGTNSQQVYFGTFNGVSDSVATPASGELTIEGGYKNFAVGTYKTYNSTTSKSTSKYCGCITSVVEWGGITSIGDYAFRDCSSLALTELPSGITSISNYAFYQCTNLALTELPSGITSIASYAFYGCTNLALTELPSGITSISNYAFYQCTNLALTELPSGITSIGSYAFYQCRGITIDTFADSVEYIYDHAFGELPWRNYSFGKALSNIGASAFYVGKSDADGASSITNIRQIIFNGCIPSIGLGAFSCPTVGAGNYSLASYTDFRYENFNNRWDEWASADHEVVGDSPFHLDTYLDGVEHSSITSVRLTDSCTRIGINAFRTMTALTSITVPASVSVIEDYALYAVPQIEMLSHEPPSISTSAISTYKTPTIIVPAGCADTYKAAEGWSTYADYIVEAS